MAIKLFGGRIIIGKDISQYTGTADSFYSFISQRYGMDYRVRNQLKANKNFVYDCVSLISEQCGNYTPMVQKKRGDQWETIDHELISLIRRPGGADLKAQSFSEFDLWEATSTLMLLQGHCYWYMANGKDTGRPREIVVMRADKVGTDINKTTGEIDGYFIRQAVGDPIPLAVEEVLHFKFYNPEDPYGGKSIVSAASDYIATDESTASFTKNFFGNNAGLSGVLNVKGEVTKGAFRKFSRGWREKYQGVDNAGKIAILRESDATFTKVGLGLDELDMQSLRDMTIQDVAMAFKVPLALLGKTEQTGLGRGNVEVYEYIFAKYNIDKKMIRFDKVLQFALERYYKVLPAEYRVIHENIIPEDKEFELAERTAAVDKWLTRDEIRDEEGLDPLTGGEKLYAPAMTTALEDIASSSDTTSSQSKGITVKIVRAAKKKDLTAHQIERFRATLMRNQLQYEKQYRRKIKPVFRAQRADVLFNLEAHSSSLAKAAEQKLFDDAAYDALLTEKITPVLIDLASTQGALALVFAGDDENEFMVTAPIRETIEQTTRRMATKYNDDTLTRLNDTLAEGIQAGEGIGKLKDRVSSVFDDVEGYRAERIARTETLHASNEATAWAYRQTGYVTQKAWAVNPGACAECSDFDGKTVPLDDDFLGLGETHTFTDENGDEQEIVNTYDTVEEPPLHPNCRCTIIPVR